MKQARRWSRSGAWLPRQLPRAVLKASGYTFAMSAAVLIPIMLMDAHRALGELLFIALAALVIAVLLLVMTGIVLTRYALHWIIAWVCLTLGLLGCLLYHLAHPEMPRPPWLLETVCMWYRAVFWASAGFSIAGWIRWLKFDDQEEW